jgi:UDP-4-amino-4,6-dideoxy-N-acetyl-beta-L-altrosamine N-acetyltransferase
VRFTQVEATLPRVSGLLRPIAESDLDRVRAWRNHPEISRFMFSRHEISESEHRTWFQAVERNPGSLVYVYEEEGESLGMVSFELQGGGVANWGFYTAPGAPRGTGYRLGENALAQAFSELKLCRVCGQALQFNTASIKFHKKLGFTHEGTLRKHYGDGSKYHDLQLFGLLFDEWQSHLGKS